jgi:para-aminobenzoate synthetase component 1
VAVNPFVTLRFTGTRGEVGSAEGTTYVHGNPWKHLEEWLEKCAIEAALPVPAGACIGAWGYDLRRFCEPGLFAAPTGIPPLPDLWAGMYSSLVVFGVQPGRALVVATGLGADGNKCERRACAALGIWRDRLRTAVPDLEKEGCEPLAGAVPCTSSLSRAGYLDRVKRALAYIRQGDIYQVNLAQRLRLPITLDGWRLYRRLGAVSPAPYAAWLDGGDFQLVSSSPELFLEFNGEAIRTGPIKGTRPRGATPREDDERKAELLASPKEAAELLMITDLMRNDLGRVCRYGSVRVPELRRVESFAQVHHLIATVRGELRSGMSQVEALRLCFPGGSVTGAPKIRAMRIIDELEPVPRGFFTGCLGYLGFNGQSRLAMTIRTATCLPGETHFHVGAGIVADSDSEAEYAETVAKARGFLAVLGMGDVDEIPSEGP